MQLAGSNGPLPTLRKLTTHVYLNVVKHIVPMLINESIEEDEKFITNWLECIICILPRLKDPITEELGKSILHFLMSLRGIDSTILDINNLIVETLDPESFMGKFYTLGFTDEEKKNMIIQMQQFAKDYAKSHGFNKKHKR
jgi:hypothetical protein